MDTTNNSLTPDLALAESTAELRDRLNEILHQLSPERLQILTDFAAYLADAESEAATEELLAIPGLLEQVQRNQATLKTEYVNWRNVRHFRFWILDFERGLSKGIVWLIISVNIGMRLQTA